MIIFITLAFLALVICIIRLIVEMLGKRHGGENSRADSVGDATDKPVRCATIDCPRCHGTGKIDVE